MPATLRSVALLLVLSHAISSLGISTVQGVTAFGYTESSSKWAISTGAGLTVTVQKASCDISSLLFQGKELSIPSNGSYVDSGLLWNGKGDVTSSIANFTDSKASIQVTCKMTGLTHYMFFRSNENNVYMGTYHNSVTDGAEKRFLALLSSTLLGTAPTPCIMGDGTPIESQDIVLVGSQTRSKFYSAVPFIDDSYHGVTGSAGGAFVVMPEHAYEISSGGPFFRDINVNVRGNRSEITYYMNSDHSRTEDYRYGFHGPYALSFTSGSAPSGLDYGFFQRRTLDGFVKEADRGLISGTISDSNKILSSQSRVVVHFYNAKAQYWAVATSALKFTSPTMIPGTYTAVVYKKELVVGTKSVTVTKGAATSLTLGVTFVNSTSIWRIGEWDGTPDEFLNADKIHTMHPSDARMAAWKPLDFTIGTSKTSQFPMALFRAINDPLRILFTLTSAQAAKAHTFRVGVTVEFYSARPSVIVNSWTGPTQTTHTLTSRSITRGVTHGNYFVYEFAVPASAFKSGQNTIQLSIASGKTDSTGFVHASLAFDALELV